ncbi:MAG TPA: hypothetical protein VED85_07830 [Burkholderiaceae bacterium]|nr:hypothetical protein [Burkholderiaceae bacterium]
MPDSAPPQTYERAANRDSFEQTIGEVPLVSANISDNGRGCLAAPPRDVGRMLERYGSALPHYLDAQRLREIQVSHQRWPMLRPLRAANDSSGP